MASDLNIFLGAFATWLASTASPALTYVGTPRNLWLGMADEAFVAKDANQRPVPYAVIQAYSGAKQWIGLGTASIQIKCVGYGDAATLALAQSIYDALLDSQGRPQRNVYFPTGSPAWRVLGILQLRPPFIVSRDEKGRPEVRINFDCQFASVS